MVTDNQARQLALLLMSEQAARGLEPAPPPSPFRRAHHQIMADALLAGAAGVKNLATETWNGLGVLGDIVNGRPRTMDDIKEGAMGVANAAMVGSIPAGFAKTGSVRNAHQPGAKDSRVVYHGTASDFDVPGLFPYEFLNRTGQPDQYMGFFVTPKSEHANTYALKAGRAYGDDGYLTYADGANVRRYRLTGDVAKSRHDYSPGRHVGFFVGGDGAEVLVTNPNALSAFSNPPTAAALPLLSWPDDERRHAMPKSQP